MTVLRAAIETAQIVVAKNQLQLGDGLCEQYNGQLKQLTDAVCQQESMNGQQVAEQQHAEAIAAQNTYRCQMESDRRKASIRADGQRDSISKTAAIRRGAGAG